MKPFAPLAAVLATILPAAALSPGDRVTPEALGAASVIQGEIPTEWEEGKVYVIECWATWCGPCVAVMPQVNALHDKYKDQGLRVIGMNVWEDGEDKVKAFVGEQGEAMSFPVAYVGRGGDFEEKWLKPAEVRGIPHTFVVKDGEYLFSTHPMELSESTVEALLAGGEMADLVVAEVRKAKQKRGLLEEQLRAFTAGDQANNADAMKAAVSQIEQVDAKFPHLARMKVDIALVEGDWDTAIAGIKAFDDPNIALMSSVIGARKFDTTAESPSPALLELFAEKVNGTEVPDPMLKATYARLKWKLGNKEEALAAAREAEELHGQLPKEPFTSFAASFEKGEPESLESLMTAIRTGMQP